MKLIFKISLLGDLVSHGYCGKCSFRRQQALVNQVANLFKTQTLSVTNFRHAEQPQPDLEQSEEFMIGERDVKKYSLG